MKRVRALVALCLAPLGAGVIASAVLASQPPPPTLTQYDQQQLAISIDTVGASVSASVGQEQAVAAAQSYLGTTAAPANVIHGQAARTVSEASRGVWIVLFDGGDQPPGGVAYGATVAPETVLYTGAIVDDTTGVVMRGFGKARTP
ncbi:MAG TPA: hypothetical protein VF802_06900 [Candidatus Limnocylindrales bacterium]